MQKEQLVILLQGYFNASLSPQERELLGVFINEPGNKAIVIEALAETGMALPAAEYNSHRFDPLLQHILAADRQVPVRTLFPWKRIAVAASIIGILFVAGYLILGTERQSKGTTHDSPLTTHDIKAPDKNRAQIKLADGSIVYLDSAANGELANVNGVKVVKTADGNVVYSPLTTDDSPLTYNTLTNPRGSKVQPLTLSDGTKLWLNAESSITYPTAFTGNQRRVEITGEAYFEVAHNKSKPFIVSANNKADVTVLGTQFNVNAYDDGDNIKITLLEGSVRVSNDVDNETIKPGEQVLAVSHSPFTIHRSPDLEQVMAWKYGQFYFNKADIKTIMKEVARWYDIDVVYETEVKGMFRFKTSRDTNVSTILKILESMGGLRLTVNGNKIIVRK